MFTGVACTGWAHGFSVEDGTGQSAQLGGAVCGSPAGFTRCSESKHMWRHRHTQPLIHCWIDTSPVGTPRASG